MTNLQRRLMVLSAWLALAAGGCDGIESAVIERLAARTLAGDRTDLLDDGSLHVVLCGTGSPIADAERAGPCTAVMAGGHFVLIDVGPGSWRRVALSRLPRARLEAVLLTHFHSDHIGELGEAAMQSWVMGRGAPLAVYGPPGVDRIVNGFREAYALDTQYRIAHHGAEALPPAGATLVAHTLDVPVAGAAVEVFDVDGLRITAFAVDHEPVVPAYGYRIDYRGRSVVVSGDTTKNANLVHHAQGVDVILHEALAKHLIEMATRAANAHGLTRWAKLTSDVLTYHTSPVEAAEVAKAAQARLLAFTHIVPPLRNFLGRRLFLRGVSQAWDGRVVIGRDGMHFSLPPNSTAIDVGQLD